MKLKALILIIFVSEYCFAGRDKELAQYAPTVGQAFIKALKTKFSSKHRDVQTQLKEYQGKPARRHNQALVDARLLLHPEQYNLNQDII